MLAITFMSLGFIFNFKLLKNLSCSLFTSKLLKNQNLASSLYRNVDIRDYTGFRVFFVNIIILLFLGYIRLYLLNSLYNALDLYTIAFILLYLIPCFMECLVYFPVFRCIVTYLFFIWLSGLIDNLQNP